jgi:hypothetical protein
MRKGSFVCLVLLIIIFGWLFKGLLTALMGKVGLIAMDILPFGIGEA